MRIYKLFLWATSSFGSHINIWAISFGFRHSWHIATFEFNMAPADSMTQIFSTNTQLYAILTARQFISLCFCLSLGFINCKCKCNLLGFWSIMCDS